VFVIWNLPFGTCLLFGACHLGFEYGLPAGSFWSIRILLFVSDFEI
jgi:hypothetical protein